MDVDEVIARVQIHEAMMRYCRGLDRGDYDTLASAYFPDAIDDHFGTGRDAHEFAADVVSRGDATPNLVGQHHITNFVIKISGHKANVESYWLAMHPDSGSLAWAGGRYLDKFECRDGEWRIARRTVICDWSRAADDPPPWPNAAGIPEGRRGKQDLSFGFLDDFDA